ncbi:unnamed protein product [Linum trigynum]|uniref:non-specific serine/threonine protein kinase n=2 Tax=Linum trigynum TaxID=586398 RepID=A0AAV2DLK8_9ROSI
MLSSNMLWVLAGARKEGEIFQATNLKSFTFSDLKAATRNFRPDSLDEGGFGYVFKGWVDENSLTAASPGTGIIITVKRLSQESCQGDQEWLTEINHLGQLYHPNLVKLIAYCIEGERRFLVHEFMPKGSLGNHLFRRDSDFQPLSLNLRMKIALDAAKGLAFLHSDNAKVIYRDFNTSNILLDSNYNAKLSDFGLAKYDPIENLHPYDTRISSAFDYGAPEYKMAERLTSNSDVYTFGVVLLEIISGRRASDQQGPSREMLLVEWARPYLRSKQKISRVMDPEIEGQYSVSCALKVAALALICLSADPKCRPTMEEVARSLEQIYNGCSSSSSNEGELSGGSRSKAARVNNGGKPRRKRMNGVHVVGN